MEYRRRQKRIGAWFAAFLAFMLLCTLISRAVYAEKLPQVTVDTAKQMALKHDVETDGTVKAGRECAVNALSGLRVNTVYTHVGERVQPDTVLFSVDMEDLKEQIAEKNLAIKKLQYQIQDLKENRNRSEQQRQLEARRAEEDFNRTDQNMRRAAEYEENEEAEDRIWEERENALLEIGRRMEDAALPSVSDHTLEIDELELSGLKSDLVKYEKVLSENGEVRPETEGIVTHIKVSSGERIPDGAAVVLADLQSPMQFSTTLTKEQKKYVSQGSTASLDLDSSGDFEVTIDYLAQNETNPEVYDMTIFLEEGAGNVGEGGRLNVPAQSGNYSCCIPIEALHEDANHRNFVYTVSSRSGILGEELAAEQVFVRVLDKNERFAAVEEGVIDRDMELIVDSTEEIGDRAVIRYKEE